MRLVALLRGEGKRGGVPKASLIDDEADSNKSLIPAAKPVTSIGWPSTTVFARAHEIR